MISYFSTHYQQLSDQLQQIAYQADNILQRAQRSLESIQISIQTLKQYILDHPFRDDQEEIEFFKRLKPQLLRELIFYKEIYDFEARRPVGNKDEVRVYYNRGLEHIRLFFERNQDLYNYHRMARSDLDAVYFLRIADQKSNASFHITEFDSRFCTVHSYKLSKILAFEKLQEYLITGLDLLDKQSRLAASDIPEGSGLTWTDSKVKLIELIYAIYFRGSVNKGNANINQLFQAAEQLFNIDLGNYYAVFQQNIRIRKKSRTVFLNELTEYLERGMDEADENPKNYH